VVPNRFLLEMTMNKPNFKMPVYMLSLRAFIKKHKERVALVGIALAIIVFIVGGIYLQKSNTREKDPIEAATPTTIALKSEHKEQQQNTAELPPATTTYFLKPSPVELLEQLGAMENLNENVIDKKFSQLPVLWSVYFFSLRDAENSKKTLLLDVSEDGFGVGIQSEVDLSLYPQLQNLAAGEKIWIGGKILAVDPAGTGTIYLETEQLSLGAEPPFPQNSQEPAK